MSHALRVLEFQLIRDRLQFHGETTLGAERAAALEPSFDADDVWRDLKLTTAAHDLLSRHSPPSLAPVRDLRDAFKRAQKGGSLGGQEIFAAADALQAMRSFKSFLRPRQSDYPELWSNAAGFPEAQRIEERVFESLEPNGDVKDAASPELQRLRQRKQSTTQRVVERIQSYVSGKARDYLSDPIYTIRDGRYVIPLKSEHKGKIKGIVHDTSGSGQTVFLEPEDVLQLGNQLREIEAAERDEVQRILGELSGRVGAVADEAVPGIEAAAYIDFILAKARLAFEMKAVAPVRWQGHGIEIQRGFHPLLDRDTAVPLDISVGFETEGLLITGPNTGGKTVAIKTVGLFALMAQAGLMLPALEVRLAPFTQVWADIGDEQSLQQSLSTFSGHIKNIAEALKHLKPGALVLFDEIGAGTDPAEGSALAKAILLELKNKGARILASTHYGELKAFAYNTEGFANAAMEFDQKTLRPTYRLLMGAPGASHALKIAERYGIPREVVERAREGLSGAEQDVANMLEQLEQAQKRARQAQSEADRRTAELRRSEVVAAKKLAEADEVRRTAHSRAQALIDEALREIRLEAAQIFEDLKNAPKDAAAQEQARKRLKDLQQVGVEFADELTPVEKKPAAPSAFKKGDSVKVEGYPQVGTLMSDPKDGNAVVQIGPMKFTLSVEKLTPAKAAPAAGSRAASTTLKKAQTAKTEIHLRAMRAEDAENELQQFLDEAVLGGLHQVRIVHGKGEGILRRLTREILKRYPHVATFRDGEPAEGGQGVTIAVMK